MNKIIDFESFRTILDMALQYSAGKKGGRPPYDPVAMFKVLILAAQSNVSDERLELDTPKNSILRSILSSPPINEYEGPLMLKYFRYSAILGCIVPKNSLTLWDF